ncbi:MAG: hypothetical protein WC560_09530 [Syntrophales bacterium]
MRTLIFHQINAPVKTLLHFISVVALMVLLPLTTPALAQEVSPDVKPIATKDNVEDDLACEPENKIKYIFTVKVWSRYLGDNAGIFYPKPVVWYDLYADLPGGWYADIWISNGLDDREFSNNTGDEIDVSAGYTGQFFFLSYNIGILYCDAYEVWNFPNGDLIKSYACLTYSLVSWNIAFAVEHYIPGGDKMEGGWLFYLSVCRVWELSPRWTLNGLFGPRYDDGAFGLDSGYYAGADFELDYQLSDTMTIGPAVRAKTPISHMDDGRNTDIVYGITFSINF